MERIVQAFAIVLAAAIAVLAVFEIDMRSDEGDVALAPTAVPSPSGPTTAAPTTMGPPSPTEAAASELPSPTMTVETTMEPTAAPTEAPTEEPTAAATSAPPVGADEMPETGGGAVGGGIAVTLLAASAWIALRPRQDSNLRPAA